MSFTIEEAKTNGVALAPAPLVVNNRLNHKLSKVQKEQGVLVDVTGNVSEKVYGVENIGKVFSDREARSKIAQAIQADIIETGGSLESSYWKDNIKLLNTLYLLTGLCYVSIESKDGRTKSSYLATKNPFCLDYMLRYCSLTRVSDKRFENIQVKRIITNQELSEGFFNVIKFEDKNKNGGKFHLTTCKLHPNSKKTLVLPYTFACRRTEAILERLKNAVCDIECFIHGEKRVIRTALKTAEAYQKAVEHSRIDACVIPVYDTVQRDTVLLNTLDIISIKEVGGKKV